MEYEKTLNLPKTNFSMRANLPQKEPTWIDYWDEMNIYEKILDKNNKGPVFILHDGPPYANGDIHLGTALNKILKDVTVRYKSMTGFYAPYVPGWDCHGLPTEQEVAKKLKLDRKTVSVVDWRNKCREVASHYVDRQRNQFRRLGVFGDWFKPYITMNTQYEVKEIRVFAELFYKGFLYRDFKSVLWCPNCETSLADAEIEYEEKQSHSIYVEFPVFNRPETYILIWTTTPWTLPGNRAVAVHPTGEYAFVKDNDKTRIILKDLIKSVENVTGKNVGNITNIVIGSELHGLSYSHPLNQKTFSVVAEEWVSLEEGTGCVHVAPGHGDIDHITGKKYGLDLTSPVDEKGLFTNEAGPYEGVSYKVSEELILAHLREKGLIFESGKILHQYPHCWRCHKPVIYRAARQWFVDVDKFREKAIEGIKEVNWLPSGSINRIESMVKARPDWCLSRQRVWGVPIPVFYCDDCEETILNEETINNLSKIALENSFDVWYEWEPSKLLPEGFSCPTCGSKNFNKETDIMDVWFDSGTSHYAVLEERKELSWPADLYLEGSDQHRGWFQTSLLTSIPLKNKAPYKNVVTSGWIVDDKGRTMHKSLGNVISPDDIISKYGADVLRLALTGSDFSKDVSISKDILEQFSDIYRKIRNTLRFIISNLYDFNESDAIPYEEIGELNQWVLHRMNNLIKDVNQSFEEYRYHRFHHLLHDFCVRDLSAFYLDIVKDRLYVLHDNHPRRKATQTTLYTLLKNLSSLIAPILTFTSEEVFVELKSISGDSTLSIHLMPFPDYKDVLNKPELEEKLTYLLDIREAVNKELESARREGFIGSSLEASVTIKSSENTINFLRSFGNDDLEDLFIISGINLENIDEEGIHIEIQHASGQKCERCWKWSSSVGENKEHLTLCSRCAEEVKRIIGCDINNE